MVKNFFKYSNQRNNVEIPNEMTIRNLKTVLMVTTYFRD